MERKEREKDNRNANCKAGKLGEEGSV